MLFLEVGRYSLRQGSILSAANRHRKPIDASSTHATPTGEPRGGMRSHREGVFGGGRHAPEAGGSAYMGGAPRLCPRKDVWPPPPTPPPPPALSPPCTLRLYADPSPLPTPTPVFSPCLPLVDIISSAFPVKHLHLPLPPPPPPQVLPRLRATSRYALGLSHAPSLGILFPPHSGLELFCFVSLALIFFFDALHT